MGIYKIKSIKVVSIEDPKTGRYTLEFQPETVQDHSITIKSGDIIRNRSWVTGFFISLMGNIALFGIVYGAMRIGYDIDAFDPAAASTRWGFILAFMLFLLSIMILYSVPASIKNIKLDTVKKARGEGAFKVIDDAKWPAFKELLDLKKN